MDRRKHNILTEKKKPATNKTYTQYHPELDEEWVYYKPVTI